MAWIVTLALAVATLVVPGSVQAAPGASEAESEAVIALHEGEYYRRNGDYPAALARYRDAINYSADSAAGKDAYLALARLQFQTRDYSGAIETLQEFLDALPDDRREATASYMLGINLQASGKLDEAADALRKYVQTSEILGGYAHSRLGEIYLKLDRMSIAVQHLTKATEYDLPQGPAIDAMENLAVALTKVGNHQDARAWRERQLSRARMGARRAEVLTRLAEAQSAQGQPVEAQGLLLDVVQEYSWTPSAERALEALAAETGVVDDFARGTVHFRNENYDEAAEAFERYLSSKPERSDAAKALYYKGLSQTYAGHSRAAMFTLEEMIALDSGPELVGEAMWQLGWLKEISGQHVQAAEWYRRSASEYPEGEAAADALFRRGLCHYRLDDLPTARAIWEEFLELHPDFASRPRVEFWLGKLLLEVGERDAAAVYLRSAASAQAWDYYGVRAREYYEARIGSFSGEYLLDIGGLSEDIPEEQAEFEEWLATWSRQPRYAFDGSYARLSADEGFKRLLELIRVGLIAEARAEIDGIRERHRGDPVALYEMLMYTRNNELYHLSIDTADDIVKLSPATTLQGVPRFLQKAVYPIHFAELILTEGRKAQVDPLLLTALIRQESMFNQQAESTARARGLGQVMPATGQSIAQTIRMGEFDSDELFKPYISISFGAYHFASDLRAFGDNPFFAMAAYNAGSGSVQEWLAGNPRVDLDLFVEDIRYSETRSYVRRVYFLYDMYRKIWAHKP